MPITARSERTFNVANRLPVEYHSSGIWKTAPGGLVSAMTPALHDLGAVWVGWSGAADGTGPREVRPALPEGPTHFRFIEVTMTPAEVVRYYDGYCNAALWPLYHGAIVAPVFRDEDYQAYREINRRFAHCVAAQAPRDACVWVHDYHLQLVPQLLRDLRPDLRIGFFLHVPFPSWEDFRTLPGGDALLEGLLGADLIGFQTAQSVDRFLTAVGHLPEVRQDGACVDVPAGAGRRSITVRAFPIGAPASLYDQAATTPAIQNAAASIRAECGEPELLILGVDRLDYTKGIERRLKAVGAVLSSPEFRHRRIRCIQLAAPSRTALRAYQALRRTVEHTLHTVNAELAALGVQPIHYVYEQRTTDEIRALYVAADVMLVTSIADGMNLVCKEYVASRPNNDGRLVLSKTTGAAAQLTDAWLVDPDDTEDIARGIRDALRASADEVAERMQSLRVAVFAYDAAHWADAFLTALRTPP